MASVAPAHPLGARILLHDESPRGAMLVAAAKKLNPNSTYRSQRYPAQEDLNALVAVRFRELSEYKPDLGKPVDCGDGDQHGVLVIREHPTLTMISAAYETLYRSAELTRGNSKALEYAWRRDVVSLRTSLGRLTELTATEAFRDLCEPLINKMGVAGAIIFVLEQAFEFERTVEYVSGSLALFKQLKGSHREKGHAFGDHDPLLLVLARDELEAIDEGAVGQHARLSVKRGRGQLGCYKAQPSEGERYHLVLGGSALEFIIMYLLHAHWRFAPFLPEGEDAQCTFGSAIYRLAVNILAHIDRDEAEAELIARMNQSNGKVGDAFKMPRDGFHLFGAKLRIDLPWTDDHSWAAKYVEGVRQRYSGRIAAGLYDEERNPFARAFPCPEAWSKPRSTRLLANIWNKWGEELSSLDRRYAPGYWRGRNALASSDERAALASAAIMLESPTGISCARSLGFPPSRLKKFI